MIGWLDRMGARIRALLTRRGHEQLLADLEFHLDEEAGEQRRRGLSPDAARAAALRSVGSPGRVVEEVREMSPWIGVDRLVQDLRFGLRGLLRNRAFTVTVLLSLGLAIGASTAIFSVADAFVFRPLPVREPAGLFKLRAAGAATSSGPGRAWELSYPHFVELRERLPLFSEIAAGGGRLDRYNLRIGGIGFDPQQIWIEPVSGNYFATLGLRASRGRLLTPDDDRAPGEGAAAVISHAYWRRRFASAPDVIGRTLAWNDAVFTIVGVGPAGFSGLSVGLATDVWLPLSMEPQAIPEAAHFLTDARARWLQLIVRLRPGVTIAQGSASAAAAWEQLQREALPPPSGAPRPDTATASRLPQLELASLAQGFQGPRARFAQPLTIVLVIVLLVLSVACVTVANLVLARSIAREREFAVRRALGASGGRLVRQLLTESSLLACGAGGLGLMLGLWIGAGAPQLLDVNLLSRAAQLDIRLDARLLAFGSILCAISMVTFGLAPVLSGSKLSLVEALTSGRVTGDGTGRVRLARGLVVVQLAASLVLITGAGLFIRTLQSLESIDVGVESPNTWIVWTRPGQTVLDERAQKAMYEQAAASLRQLPGVREASLSYGALFPAFPHGSAIEAVDGPLPPASRATTEALWRFSAPRVLGAVGIPLIAGRDFSDRDHASAPHVAIVNQVLARELFGAGDPIGRRFRFASGGAPIEIVGLMRDTVFESPREAPRPTFYRPHTQTEGSPGGLVWLAVRPESDGDELPPQIRRTLRELSPNLAILSIERMGEALDRTRAQERLLAIVSIGFAAVAALLTAIGLYGIIAFTTARRLHEVGVRLALGATSGSVVRLVLRDTIVVVSIGIAIGAPAALALSSLIESQLYGVAARDPFTLLAATALMAIVAVAAGYLPARRAAMTDPTIVLRGE